MRTPAFRDSVNCLTGDQPPRVWSLLVTVFGELAQEKGARISGAVLKQITARIGIKPEAMRVALYRLRKDGWIQSERKGRTSVYFLTDWGRAQSAAASPMIYATDAVTAPVWLVILDPTRHHDLAGTPYVAVTSHIVLTTRPPDDDQAILRPLDTGAPLPDWIAAKVCDTATLHLSHDFADRLSRVAQLLDGTKGLNAIEIATLRVLIVHSWRRIVLKAPPFPDDVFPQPWSGAICRKHVAQLLTTYPKQTAHDLEGPDAMSVR